MTIRIQALLTFIDKTSGAYVIAINGENVIGAVTVNHLNSKSATLTSLFVSPQYRRKGVAKQLLAKAYELSIHAGCQSVSLVVQPYAKAALALYRKSGFILGFEYTNKSMLLCRAL